MASAVRRPWRLLGAILVSALSLQLYFAARIALMNVLDPQSTTFQRSEMSRLLREQGRILWSQEWQNGDRISDNLRHAVVASEDANFVDHHGVEWDALENAWRKNSAAQAKVDRVKAQVQDRYNRAVERAQKRGRAAPPPPTALTQAAPKVIGGSTITQQLAKNLFLSSERQLFRKAQELAITLMLEGLLSKDRILTIYLNNVEWGEGVFGAQAASQHYFRVNAAQLSPMQAARLAVMLPAPKRFEKQPASGYILSRSGTIAARMGGAEIP